MLASSRQHQALIQLFHTGTQLTFHKGELIIRPGEVPDGIFFIQSGLVKAYDISKYGEENLLIVRKEAEVFPLIWALTGQERHITYEALNTVIVWRLSRKVFAEQIQLNPDVLPPMLDMVVEMYRIHSERIINLEYRSVRERLISFLLTMSQRFGRPLDGEILIDLPLRHQDIASSINASRETTGRELVLLAKKGWLHYTPSTIVLTNIPALEACLVKS